MEVSRRGSQVSLAQAGAASWCSWARPPQAGIRHAAHALVEERSPRYVAADPDRTEDATTRILEPKGCEAAGERTPHRAPRLRPGTLAAARVRTLAPQFSGKTCRRTDSLASGIRGLLTSGWNLGLQSPRTSIAVPTRGHSANTRGAAACSIAACAICGTGEGRFAIPGS